MPQVASGRHQRSSSTTSCPPWWISTPPANSSTAVMIASSPSANTCNEAEHALARPRKRSTGSHVPRRRSSGRAVRPAHRRLRVRPRRRASRDIAHTSPKSTPTPRSWTRRGNADPLGCSAPPPSSRASETPRPRAPYSPRDVRTDRPSPRRPARLPCSRYCAKRDPLYGPRRPRPSARPGLAVGRLGRNLLGDIRRAGQHLAPFLEREMAVISAPLRSRASTTTVTCARPAMIVFLPESATAPLERRARTRRRRATRTDLAREAPCAAPREVASRSNPSGAGKTRSVPARPRARPGAPRRRHRGRGR